LILLVIFSAGPHGAGEGATPPGVRFRKPITTAPGNSYPFSLAVGDFNNDGILDLTVVGPTNGNLELALGRGNGTFGPWQYSPAAGFPGWITNADFNGDGNLDAAVADPTYNFVSILLGTGKGTFQGGTSISSGTSPIQVVDADLNGDGKQDIAFVDGKKLWVFLGNGDGTFQTGHSYRTGVSSGASWLAVGDFNGDQKLDVVVSNAYDLQSHGSVAVLLGNGDGTFQPGVISYRYDKTLGNVAVGDFNKDGKLDVVVAIPDTTNDAMHKLVRVLWGNGDGTLRVGPLLDSGPSPSWIEVADFNGDGNPDVAVANAPCIPMCGQVPVFVTVVLGNGDGTFQRGAHFPLPGGKRPIRLAVADFNGDKKPDIAVLDILTDTVSIFINAIKFPPSTDEPE
jgi:hypothetical protein